jgi:hypothetical protein
VRIRNDHNFPFIHEVHEECETPYIKMDRVKREEKEKQQTLIESLKCIKRTFIVGVEIAKKYKNSS